MTQRIAHLKFWLKPVVMVLIVLCPLAALYFGAIANPAKHLHHFPVAIVNLDQPEPGQASYGNRLADTIHQQTDSAKFDLQDLSWQQAQSALSAARLYTVIVIAPDFSASVGGLTDSAAHNSATPPRRPTVTIWTNPRAGSMGTSIGATFATERTAAAGAALGAYLLQTRAHASTALEALALHNPVSIATQPFKPLPDNAGNGLTAFYFTLLLMMGGFTGAMVVHQIIDVALGFAPTESGPHYRSNARVTASRVQLLLINWASVTLLAVILPAAYLLVLTGIGVDLPRMPALYGFSVLAVAAVGITAISIVTIVGGWGMRINLIFFIALGLPSSGGVIALQAAPPFYRYLSTFEPMHQIYMGTRSLLYFDANMGAGLGQALLMITAGVAAGIAAGLVGNHLYDKRGMAREPEPPDGEQSPS